MSRPVMYIFLNKGLGMSAGKLATQSSHAAVEAYRNSKPELIKEWYLGQHYTKIVLEARDENALYTIQRYLQERGFGSHVIIDEGMTEIDPHQATALGVQLVDKDDPHTAATFSSFKLYKDKVRLRIEIDR